MGSLWLVIAAKAWRHSETGADCAHCSIQMCISRPAPVSHRAHPSLAAPVSPLPAGLALLAASYVLNELGQTALIQRVPCFKAARVRCRELFFLGTCLHTTVAVLALGALLASQMPALLWHRWSAGHAGGAVLARSLPQRFSSGSSNSSSGFLPSLSRAVTCTATSSPPPLQRCGVAARCLRRTAAHRCAWRSCCARQTAAWCRCSGAGAQVHVCACCCDRLVICGWAHQLSR